MQTLNLLIRKERCDTRGNRRVFPRIVFFLNEIPQSSNSDGRLPRIKETGEIAMVAKV